MQSLIRPNQLATVVILAMMSMITPPVALAAFAAATITKENPLTTGIAAMRVGWAAFIIPFIFVATPAILLEGSWFEITQATLLSIAGIYGVTAGIVGFSSRQLGPILRTAMLVSGALALPLGFYSAADLIHWPAAALVVVIAAALFVLRRSSARASFKN